MSLTSLSRLPVPRLWTSPPSANKVRVVPGTRTASSHAPVPATSAAAERPSTVWSPGTLCAAADNRAPRSSAAPSKQWVSAVGETDTTIQKTTTFYFSVFCTTLIVCFVCTHIQKDEACLSLANNLMNIFLLQWKQALSQFCVEEYGTMTLPYECCEDGGDARWTCFDSELPNPNYSSTPGYTAPIMPQEPGFNFNANAC